MNSRYLLALGYGGLLVILYWWTVVLLRPGLSGGGLPWIFLDYLNLLVHEAGHWLFLPLGRVMTIMGGSLLQCLLPMVFAGYFAYKREWAGLAFGVWWMGDAVVNVGRYVADAGSRSLPLLGGDGVGHDWFILLSGWGWLEHDRLLGELVYGVGAVLMLVGLLGLSVLVLQLLVRGGGRRVVVERESAN